MDLMLLTGIAVALLIILLTVYFIQSKRNKSDSERLVEPNRLGGQRNQGAVARRVQIARNQRNRIRLNVANQHENGGERQVIVTEEENSEVSKGQVLDEKMGTKKRAKLEAKEAKRQMREEELKQREDRKAREAKLEEERKKQEAKENEEEHRQLEVERLAREQKERKELEDYLKMKETFSVEEEGFDDAGDDEKENLFVKFINYIKINKVVILEDLATEFNLKTQQVIDRIQELQKNGTMTGVIDDRGKFIYISEEELQAVAKFIRQRGRVSISELAECSNNLIHITPITSSVD